MSRKTKVQAAVGLALAVGLSGAVTASLPSAVASTSACGSSCTTPAVESLGTGQALAVSGSSVVMAAASITSTGQDWTPQQEGDVSNAVSAGVLSGKLNMLYSTDQLVEFEYAPGGVASGQCLANTSTDVDENSPYNVPTLTVVLAQCGLTAQSLWILDASNEANGYIDLVNAGYEAAFTYLVPNFPDSNDLTSPFAEPAVLTVNSSGKVVLALLNEVGGVVSPTQLWANWSAPAQGGLRAKVAKSR